MTYCIGIAGGSASGKSTFATALKAVLESGDNPRTTLILSMDRFAVEDRSAGPHFLFSYTGEPTFDWNRPEAFDIPRLIDAIDAGKATLGEKGVLLVEGLMILHDPGLRSRLDLKIFVELDADLRAIRRLLRDMAGGRASKDPAFIAAYYIESARVGHALYVEPSRAHADIVLHGDGDPEKSAHMVAAIVNATK